MALVYVETTVISYLASRPSRDVVLAGHQAVTREWWEKSRLAHHVFVSEVVLSEIRAGDPAAASRREALVEGIRVLAFTEDVAHLAHSYHGELGLPAKAGNDVLHIAFAVSYELDYLLTWNCTHIANGHTIQRLNLVNTRLGRRTPVIITPEGLLED